mgnify:CR=1 FL=1
MTALLPWLVLASTLAVRFSLARKWRWGFWLDLASVPAWAAYYLTNGDPQLLIIVGWFAFLDVKALKVWWK